MLLPRVAAIKVRRRGSPGEASGSAVVLTSEGHLLTNAHVVGDADAGEATFADGSVALLEIVGRDPLADLAIVRADRPTTSRRSTATSTTSGSGPWSWPWATRWAWPAASPPGWSAASGARSRPYPQGHPHRRGRDPDRRSAEPGQLGRRPRRLPRPRHRHQHRGRRRRPRARRADQRDLPTDHSRSCTTAGYDAATSDWTSPAPLPPDWATRGGQRQALRVVEVISGSPASSSGLRPGDLILAVSGTPLGDAQSLQRLLFEESIGARMEITVLRNGALVDAVAFPAELSD